MKNLIENIENHPNIVDISTSDGIINITCTGN